MKIKLRVRTQLKTNNYKLMTLDKNDPNCEVSYTSKKYTFLTVGNLKIRKDNKNTKSHFFDFLIKSIQSGVKSVYDRGYTGKLHQFQCHTV